MLAKLFAFIRWKVIKKKKKKKLENAFSHEKNEFFLSSSRSFLGLSVFFSQKPPLDFGFTLESGKKLNY